jgi:hypothetical protein
LRRGLVLSSWDRWVVANGGDGTATLESVNVSSLSNSLEGHRYHLCRDAADELEEKRRRESLLEDLRGWKPGSRNVDRYHRRIGDWREMSERFLCEVYSLYARRRMASASVTLTAIRCFPLKRRGIHQAGRVS